MKKQLGVLCHVSSLPSEYGVGDFGNSAKNFIDFLSQNNINIWQILPLNKTNKYNCPYASTCYFSYDEMFVDLNQLSEEGKISQDDLLEIKNFSNTKKVDYDAIKKIKNKLFEKAYKNITQQDITQLKQFLQNNNHYFYYAYFRALLKVFKTQNWRDIDKSFWDKNSKSAQEFISQNSDLIYKYGYYQFVLDGQWQKIRKYANQKGVKILGDIPIYPAPNSFDVFNNLECYLLDKNTYNPLVFGGVPKDEFCEVGQNWGTCVYDWKHLEKTQYKYIIEKINLTLQKYDILRLDHFFGYVEHYEHSATKNGEGQWVKGGGKPLFDLISKNCNIANLVVEDLGFSKQQVEQLKKQFNLRGMCVVQMIMESNENIKYLPQNVPENCIYYLGTHDNNTFMGYLKSLDKTQKNKLCKLINIKYQCNKKLHIKCMQKMLESKSELVVFQIQDLLLQGEKFRMNIPGKAAHCWEYKVPKNYAKKVQKTLSKISWK